MKFLAPTPHRRLNEAVGFLLLLAGLAIVLSLASYHPLDPSWNTATGETHVANLLGRMGAVFADFTLQLFGLSAYLLPVFVWLLGWKWVRSSPIESSIVKLIGAVTLWLAVSTACGLVPEWKPITGGVPASGVAGMVISGALTALMNPTGAAIATAAWAILSLYLLSKFEVAMLQRLFAGPIARVKAIRSRIQAWSAAREEKSRAKAKEQAAERRRARGGRAPSRQAETGAPLPEPVYVPSGIESTFQFSGSV
ncbi:MAG TPA: DNA translocase FtsK 4TM domain-containing protein, partial [Bryobacteraceae bacterium]